MKTVKAYLNINMYVECPNKTCGWLIDLRDSSDTNESGHDDDNYLRNQMFLHNGEHESFKCEDVVCTRCKTKFNVKGLEW